MPNYGKYSCLCEYILKECIANVNTILIFDTISERSNALRLDMICNYVDKIIFMGKEIYMMNNPNNYDLGYQKFEEICEISKEL